MLQMWIYRERKNESALHCTPLTCSAAQCSVYSKLQNVNKVFLDFRPGCNSTPHLYRAPKPPFLESRMLGS